jgi:hypothetical protein
MASSSVDVNGPTNGDTASAPPSSKVRFNGPAPPVTAPASTEVASHNKMVLEMQDGTLFEGYSFGADRSIAGECVFQTGEFSLFWCWERSCKP